MFKVRRGNVFSAEMLFHVPPHRPRNKEEFVSNPAADCGKRTPPGVAFQRVPLFLCQNVPLQTICRCVLRFKDYGAPAVKRSLKELEDAGLILRVRRGVGEPNRIYTLLPKKEGCRDE